MIHKSFTHHLRRFLYWKCYLERALEWLLPREMGLGAWTRRLTRVLANIWACRGKEGEWTHAEKHRHSSHTPVTCGCWPWAAHEAELPGAADGLTPDSEAGIAPPTALVLLRDVSVHGYCRLQKGQRLPSHGAAFSAGPLGHRAPLMLRAWGSKSCCAGLG